MSNKVFTILRNNKEQGPYSLEEVLQLSLKPQDLIWEEGSVGWRAPSENAALQPYFNTSGDTPQRPVIRASRIFISYPKNVPAATIERANVQTQTANGQSAPTLENEEPTAESLEIKAAQIYQRVMAYNDQKKQEQQSIGSQDDYSLHELRQEYAVWNQGKNKKQITHPKINHKKSWLKKSGIAGVIALGIFIALRSTTFKSKAPQQLYETNSILPVKNKKIDNVTGTSVNNKQNIATGFIKKDSVQKLVEGIPKELTVDEFIDSVRKVMARQDRRR